MGKKSKTLIKFNFSWAFVLFLVLLILKCIPSTIVATWPWWVIFSPLWVPFALFLGVCAVIGVLWLIWLIVYLIVCLFD